MVRFVITFLLYSLPVIAIFAFPLSVYVQGREFTTLSSVIEAQQGSPDILFSLAYSSVNKTYKKMLLQEREAEIVALGSSRVGQFRNQFFLAPEKFANASNAAVDIQEMTDFVRNLDPDSSVRLLIVGFDQRHFDPHDHLPSEVEHVTLFERVKNILSGQWKKVYVDYMHHKFTLTQLSRAQAESADVGVLALINKNGFLPDGSYYEGKIIGDAARLEVLSAAIVEERSKLERVQRQFQYQGPASEESREKLRTFLEVCRDRHIDVIAILPPYAPALYPQRATDADAPGFAGDELSRSLADVFAEFNVQLFDYSNARTVGIQDSEFADILHGTDKAYLRILIDMAKRSTIVDKVVDQAALEKTLKNTEGDFVLTLK